MSFIEVVRHYARAPVSQALVDEHLPEAERKLNRIISREGDSNGERLHPSYLAQLVAETIRSAALMIRCAEHNEKVLGGA